MIFKEEEIMNTGKNFLEILEEANYVDIPIISPNTIAVCEASITDDVSVGVIRYSDIESLCEEYGLDYDEALSSIANTNNIDINALCIAVDESYIIENPDIVDFLPNVVISPISENSLAYQYCEMLLEEYINSGDELFLEAIVDESVLNEWHPESQEDYYTKRKIHGGSDLRSDEQKAAAEPTEEERRKRIFGQTIDDAKKTGSTDAVDVERSSNSVVIKGAGDNKRYDLDTKEEIGGVKRNARRAKSWVTDKATKGKDWVVNNPKKAAGIAAGTAALVGGGIYLKHKANTERELEMIQRMAANQPKGWIAKKIASLRNMYSQWLEKANHAVNSQQAGLFKKIAAKIMNVIDSLMARLQHMAG